MSSKLFLIDGTALAYRSYFAMINSRLRNSEGLPTGALYGFATALTQILEKENPTHIAVVWDTHAPTFRHEMDAAYKANRPPQPDELKQSIPVMKELVAMLGLSNLERDGFEADDIIGTLATQAKGEQVTVFMVTPDKDFMQLVGENVYMLKPGGKGDGFSLIDRSGVESYFGVGPERVTDVLALIGDTSDNVPGVPGIGKKGAAKLIGEYGTLEQLIASRTELKNKRAREGLEQGHIQALKSRDMVRIHTQVPQLPKWNEVVAGQADLSRLSAFFEQMQFRTLRKKWAPEGQAEQSGSSHSDTIRNTDKADRPAQGALFEQQAEPHPLASDELSSVRSLLSYDPESVQYTLCTTMEQVKELARELKSSPVYSFDTETTSSDPAMAELLGISFSTQKGAAWFVPAEQHERSFLVDTLGPLFNDSNRLKVAHHIKYDIRVLERHGFTVCEPIADTMLAAHLLDAGQKVDMDSLAERYLEYAPISIESLIGEKGRKQRSMREVPIDALSVYACEDADVTLQLHQVLMSRLEHDGLTDLAVSLEFPLARVLARMEYHGIHIDLDMLAQFSSELDADIVQIQQQIYETAGESFNINSTRQLGQILFDKLGIPSRKKTATGQYATSEQVLSSLSGSYPVVDLVLQYRQLSKLKSTYVDALPRLVHPETGRIHTTYNQHVTATGRLSSTQPNLQNIPVRTERGRGIRRSFVAEPGNVLLAADYSQIELRIIASMSDDKAMIQAFRQHEDIHARTAAEIFHLGHIDDVAPEQRRKAKEVNFGIPYGVSAFGLAQRLGISNSEAKDTIEAYFDRFPSIRTFIDETVAFAREHGYVETLMGRRRYIPDIHARNQNVRSFAERTAVNMPIQGTAADLIKKAMIDIQRLLEQHSLATRMLLQVHDELVFELPEQECEQAAELIRLGMEQAMKLKVPLVSDVGIADNWLQAH